MWAGSGHNSAGDLYAQVLKEDKRFEVVRYISPTKYVDSHYSKITKYFPSIYNFIIKKAPTLLSDLVTLYAYRLVDECVWLLDKEKPDIVIGTHFSQFQASKIAERILKINPLSIETFLDYGAKSASEVPYNIFLRPDYSIIYDEYAKSWLAKKMRANKDYFVFGGHKARNEFREIVDKYKTKHNALKEIQNVFKGYPYDQISSEKTTILITSGGGGTVQRVYKLLKRIASLQKNNLDFLNKYQFFIICGSNKGFFNKIQKIRSIRLSWQNFFPFSWLNPKQYAHLQFASDYPVLYSIAPATMFELLETKCLPIIVHKLRGDHEKGNANYLVENNVGKYVNRLDQVLMEIFTDRKDINRVELESTATNLLKNESLRLSQFSDKLFKIHKDFKPNEIDKRYMVSKKHKFFSSIMMMLFTWLYSVFRLTNWLKIKYRRLKSFF